MPALRTAPPPSPQPRASLPPALAVRVRDRLHIATLRSRPGLASKLLLGLALIGPGVLVMLGDNDAGGVITYAQTGAARGLGFSIPLMIPLVPVERMRPSGWYTAAFWILRLYVGAMLAVVTYAFVHGSH